MPGSLVQNIQKSFHLTEDLAKKYASIVFLACIRFETSKRKLQHLTFAALKQCTEMVMDSWTYTSVGIQCLFYAAQAVFKIQILLRS